MDFFPFLFGVSNTLITVFLIHLSGYLLARISVKPPLLTNSFLSDLSRFVITIFLPCLVFSQFTLSMSIEMFYKSWVLILWGVIIPLIGIAIGFFLPKLITFDQSLHRPIILSCGIQNGINYSLLYAQGLCKNIDEFSEIEDCYPMIASYSFIQTIGFTVIFFGFFYQYLHDENQDSEKERENLNLDKISWKSWFFERISKYHILIAIFLSMTIGLIKPLKDLFISGYLISVQSAIESIGHPTIVISSIIFGGLIGLQSAGKNKKSKKSDKNENENTELELKPEPAVDISLNLNTNDTTDYLSDINLTNNLSDKDSKDKTNNLSDINLTNNLSDKDSKDKTNNLSDINLTNNLSDNNNQSNMLIFSVCFIKLILVPFIGFSIILLIIKIGGPFQETFLPKDILFRLVLVIQFAAPSAVIIIITLCKMANRTKTRLENAFFVARVFFWMYCMSMITVFGWTLLGMYIIKL